MRRSHSLLLFVFGVAITWSFPHPSLAAPTPPTVDICSQLSNPSFENGLTGWSTAVPSDDYVTPVPFSPSYTPLGTSTAIAPQAGTGFAGCIQHGYGADNSKCRLDHDIVNGNWAAGTKFTITVLANHGRVIGANTPDWHHNKQSDANVMFQSWTNANGGGAKINNDKYKFVEEGAWTPALGSNGLPNTDPRTGNDENNPNGYGHPLNTWVSKTIVFTAPSAIKSFRFSLSGLNDAHDSFVVFDTDCGGTPPPTSPGNQPPREP